MRNLFFLLCVAVSITACSNGDSFERSVKERMEISLKSYFSENHYSELKLSDPQTVWCDDSLCIIETTHSEKDLDGEIVSGKIEYITIKYDGKLYESIHKLSSEEPSVYISETEYEKNRSRKIYGCLSYPEAVRYLAIRQMNDFGREVGSGKTEGVNIPVNTGTGKWQIVNRVDKDGKETEDLELRLKCHGAFSDDTTIGSALDAYLNVDEQEEFSFKLYKYGKVPVTSCRECRLFVMEMNGAERCHNAQLMCWKTGEITTTLWQTEYDPMGQVINNCDTAMCSIKTNDGENASTYTFFAELSGYKKARDVYQSILRMGHEDDKNLLSGAAYVNKCKKNPLYKRVGRGIYRRVIKKGNGKTPRGDEEVEVRMSMRSIDGTVIKESGTESLNITKAPFIGYSEALSHMPVGSKWEVVVPEKLAFGARNDLERMGIKPFSTIIMTIELLDIYE